MVAGLAPLEPSYKQWIESPAIEPSVAYQQLLSVKTPGRVITLSIAKIHASGRNTVSKIWSASFATAPRIVIPKDAILRGDASPFVYVVRGGVAMPVNVRIAFPLGDDVALEPGAIAAGDEVVTEGNERLLGPTPVAPIAPSVADGVDGTGAAGITGAASSARKAAAE